MERFGLAVSTELFDASATCSLVWRRATSQCQAQTIDLHVSLQTVTFILETLQVVSLASTPSTSFFSYSTLVKMFTKRLRTVIPTSIRWFAMRVAHQQSTLSGTSLLAESQNLPILVWLVPAT
jgi:hypothetical protein